MDDTYTADGQLQIPYFVTDGNLIGIQNRKLKALVFNNTVMPQFCGQIKVGNGVYGRHDGSIIVGTLAAPGCIVSPRSAFDLIFERIRKNIERGKCVSLKISD